MKALHKQFILQLLLISIVIYGILYVVFTRFIIASLPLIIMVALLFAVNSLVFIIITNTKAKKPGSFVYSYMTVSFGRLIVCSAFVFAYALMHKQDARTFALTFFLLYFIYTTIEVKAMYSFFKN
jgi:hypothetical protein